MPDTTHTTAKKINGIDVDALMQVVRDVEADPKKGMVEFRVNSNWTGQTKSQTKVESYMLGGNRVARQFTMVVDEPLELLGENTAPNPQEYLMTALNACIMVGYVAGAAVKGIKLDKVEIESSGTLDLRGFLGIDASVRPGYDKINTIVRLKGNGTAQQFREIHENVMKTSPNYFNVSRSIPIDSKLIVE